MRLYLLISFFNAEVIKKMKNSASLLVPANAYAWLTDFFRRFWRKGLVEVVVYDLGGSQRERGGGWGERSKEENIKKK